MTNYEALDIIFNFIPPRLLLKFKGQGLYEPILSRRITTGAELYDCLNAEQARWQDNNYGWLIKNLAPLLNRGATLQIGCGRGDLLKRLADYHFKPLYGVDRSRVMLSRARERLADYRRVYLLEGLAENLDLTKLPKFNNVIINNFWGLLPKNSAVRLLENLKQNLSEHGQIIIGPWETSGQTPEKSAAEKILKNELGFIFSFPFFKNFSSCGYLAKIVLFNRRPYFILKPKPNIYENY